MATRPWKMDRRVVKHQDAEVYEAPFDETRPQGQIHISCDEDKLQLPPSVIRWYLHTAHGGIGSKCELHVSKPLQYLPTPYVQARVIL